jgi:hypothetical protein
MSFKSDSDLTQKIKEAKLVIDLPSKDWSLADKQNIPSNGMTVYFYSRKSILDSKSINVVPFISIIIEDVQKDLDITKYAIAKNITTPFKTIEVLTPENGKLQYSNSIGFKGSYVGKYDIDHTIFVVYAIKKGKGFHMICDVTTELVDKVESEFLSTVLSIRE